MQEILNLVTKTTGLRANQVENTIELHEQGATIPFISRYRKEVTGSLDEVQISDVIDAYKKYQDIAKRKETILKTIEEQGKLTPELKSQIEKCWDATLLEDIYLPYKPKKQTRGEKAKKLGLEPLANLILEQKNIDIDLTAEKFLTDDVKNVEVAIQGAMDIIAEHINEDMQTRQIVRSEFERFAVLYSKVAKGKELDGIKYVDYFEFSQPLNKIPSHRLLAIKRGENEGFLKVRVEPEKETLLDKLKRKYIRANNSSAKLMETAIDDSYKRLIQPSLENEFVSLSKLQADIEAVKVFSKNLKQLLLSSPLGQKNVLALDPGYRTGCKLVCLDKQGTLLYNTAIYPHQPQNDYETSKRVVLECCKKFAIEAIAIGNGTASRETEDFARSIGLDSAINIFVVSENGASIYSASKVARDEFPDYDVTVRGAISIGRRLIDPLAELVKIDPKSIGVGQYQHDVDQTLLKASLDQVVENCVNLVGVNINTASVHLLTFVSGLGPQLAKNIVDYRTSNGDFKSRTELKKVSKLGDKTFEQCAGFLRISNPKNPLDNSSVHPESYNIVEQMAKDLNISVIELMKTKENLKRISLDKYISAKVGLPTLTDIVKELEKPGLDPRSVLEAFSFDQNIKKIEDVKEGMILPAIVTNITNFGAFVDMGIKTSGLIHISNMSDTFVKDPSLIVSLHQQVEVKVIEVDLQRNRIQLKLMK